MFNKITSIGEWIQHKDKSSDSVQNAIVSVDSNGIQVEGIVPLNAGHITLTSFALLFLMSTGFGLIIVPFYWTKIVSIYTGKYKSEVHWRDVEQIGYSDSELLLYGSDSGLRVIFRGEVSQADVTQRMPGTVKISNDIEKMKRLIVTDELVIDGQWHSHWSFRSELSSKGRLSITPKGIAIVGTQTSLWRQFVLLIVCLLLMVVCSVGFFGSPTIALYISEKSGYFSMPLLKLSIVVSISFAVLFFPMLVLIRAVFTKSVRQFVPWEFLHKVGCFPDGLWLEMHNVSGDLRGHFTSKNVHLLLQAYERIQLWDEKVEVMDKKYKVMPVIIQRGLLLMIALCSIGFSWVYREEQKMLLNGLNRQVQQVTHPTQVANITGYSKVRTDVAQILQSSPPKWASQLSIQQNEQTLMSDLNRLLQQLPSHPMAKGIFVEQYLDLFPFAEYLQQVSYGNGVAQTIALADHFDRVLPTQHFGDGLIINLTAVYLSHFPPSIDAIQVRLDIAEKWQVAGENSGRASCLMASRFFVSQLTHAISEAYKSGNVSKSEANVLVKRLQSLGANLDLPLSSLEKLLFNVLAGNKQYISNRVKLKLASYVSDPSSNIKQLQSSKFSTVSNSQNASKTWSEGPFLKDGRKIGWIGVLSSYSSGKVQWYLNNDKPIDIPTFSSRFGRRPLVLTSGSYVTSTKKTSGLSATGGVLANSAVDPKMDGLVIIHKGEVSIHNIDAGVYLPGKTAALQVVDLISDYMELISWIQQENASVFQTHLLGFDNDLAIDPSKASTTLRERRLLATIERNGQLGVAIVDLPQTPRPLSLSEAAATTLFGLRQLGWTVQGIANLDVGTYNILYRVQPRKAESLAPVPLSKAHNLLVIME
jgi:hypothetical protein